MQLDSSVRAEIIDHLITKLHDHYIFPEVVGKLETALRERLASGAYDAITNLETFQKELTDCLHEVSHDKHLRLWYNPERLVGVSPEENDAARQKDDYLFAKHGNFGFAKIEWLPGNVGYLDLRGFFPVEHGGDTAVAAMNLLAPAYALIIDLRHNGGGSPAMVELITTYLFGSEPVHLNSMYHRESDLTQQFWTLPYVTRKRFGGDAIYVLTSSRTFSGAEEFAYNLQSLERATIIGEVTGGGANPGGIFHICGQFEAFISTGRAVNPITQGNWEGVGVKPDVEVPEALAFKAAQQLALRHVLERVERETAEPFKDLSEEVRAALGALERDEQLA